MENFKRGGYEGRRQDNDRRDYGNNSYSENRFTGSYTEEGRKLRHRKPRNSGDNSGFVSNSERVSYERSERRGYGNSTERRGYGNNSDRRGYGDNSERRSFNGERQSFGGDRRRPSYNGERRSYGNSGEGRGFGRSSERSGYGYPDRGNYEGSERRSYGNSERRSYNGVSDRRSYGDNNERRGYNSDRQQFGGDRRNGGRKPQGSKGFAKREQTRAELGINRMLSRKPQLSDERFSDNDMINIPVKEEVRLNKYIANSGVCSRREADNYILAGVVTVNGEIVTELGSKVNIYNDDVRFNGERLKGEAKVYIVMNKPKGFVTTASDPHADKTVMDLLKGCNSRVFPVGRLDKNTTGVLMFTNDGEIAEKLTHPSYDKKKIYQVSLDKELAQEDFDHIMSGVELADGIIAADELEYIDENDRRKLGIEIHSGKNRIVRRIFESLGYTVKALDRVYFAGLTKKNIKRGQWRFLTEGEVNVLKMGAYV